MSGDHKYCLIKKYLGQVPVGEHRMLADPIDAVREFGKAMKAVNFPLGDRFVIETEQGEPMEQWAKFGDDWRLVNA